MTDIVNMRSHHSGIIFETLDSSLFNFSTLNLEIAKFGTSANQCENECCSDLDCFKTKNKNGDTLLKNKEEILLIFGGKIVDKKKNNDYRNCYKNLSADCDEIISKDLWFYYIDQNKWSKIYFGINLDLLTITPSPRYGHTAVLVTKNDSNSIQRKFMYIYGGYNNIDCFGNCDDMWVYEIPWAPQQYYPSDNKTFWNRGNHWRKIQFGDQGPGRRSFHSMVIDKNNNDIYLFGGSLQVNNDFKNTNDLWKFSIEDEKWEQIMLCGITDISRIVTLWDGTVINSKLTLDDKLFKTDNFIYSTVKNKESCIELGLYIPKCRSFSSMTIDINSLIYIYGGVDSSNELLDDFWIINITSKQCSFQTNKIIEIHDINNLNLNVKYHPNALKFLKISTYKNNDYIFLFGGINKNTTTNELWIWSSKNRIWMNHSNFTQISKDISSKSNAIKSVPELSGHIFLEYSKGIIIHGGISYKNISGILPDNSGIEQFNYSYNSICNPLLINYLISNDYSIIDYFKRESAFLNTKSSCFKQIYSKTILLYPEYNSNLYLLTESESCINPLISNNTFQSCFFGKLICNISFYGEYCQNKQCPNSFCLNNLEDLSDSQCEFCSKHGVCDNGVCKCDTNYTGNDCSIIDCKKNCSDFGSCKREFVQSQCDCKIDVDDQRGDVDCSFNFCLNDCGKHGVCNNKTAKCTCNEKYSGEDCSIFNISLFDYSFWMRFNKYIIVFILFIYSI